MTTQTPTRKSSTTTHPVTFKRAKLRRLADGTIQALSSDGQTVYTVTLDPEGCTCPAMVRCYHARTAAVRFGSPAATYGEELIAFLSGEPLTPAAGATDPQSPPPADSPAPRRTRTVAGCNCDLYGDDPDCPVHGAAVQS